MNKYAEMLVKEFPDGGWFVEAAGRPHKMRSIKTVTLTSLLRFYNAPPVIEFLALDTEGSKPRILMAHDFNAFRFLRVLVEHNQVPARLRLLRSILEPSGYELTSVDGNNALFGAHNGIHHG